MESLVVYAAWPGALFLQHLLHAAKIHHRLVDEMQRQYLAPFVKAKPVKMINFVPMMGLTFGGRDLNQPVQIRKANNARDETMLDDKLLSKLLLRHCRAKAAEPVIHSVAQWIKQLTRACFEISKK